MRGRKPLFKPETLKRGEKLDLKDMSIYGHQYAFSFNKRLKSEQMKFKFIDGFIVRVE